jgi:hypothetical protein
MKAMAVPPEWFVHSLRGRNKEGKMKTLILAASLALANVDAMVAESGPRVAMEAPHQHKAKLVRLLQQQFPDSEAVTAIVRDNRLYLCVWKGDQAQVAILKFDGSLRTQLADLRSAKERETKIGSLGPAQ